MTKPTQPKAKSPWTDLPTTAITNLPLQLRTNSHGKAQFPIKTEDPGNPRGYIDGQIYTLLYSLEGQEDIQRHSLDAIYILLFDGYSIPAQPTWLEHIHPIFQQYGNLYPIMSKRLVDLGDYDSVREHRAILELAFSLDIHDPNSMPVTRDLSQAKRATILRWLREQDADGGYVLRLGKLKYLPAQELLEVEPTSFKSLVPELEAEDNDATTHGYENLKIALRRHQSHS